MNKKLGPFPVWLLVAAAGAIVLGLWFKRRAATVNNGVPISSPIPISGDTNGTTGGTVAPPASGIPPDLWTLLANGQNALVAEGQSLAAIAMNSTTAATNLAATVSASSFDFASRVLTTYQGPTTITVNVPSSSGPTTFDRGGQPQNLPTNYTKIPNTPAQFIPGTHLDFIPYTVPASPRHVGHLAID